METIDQIIDIDINISQPVSSADGYGVPAIIYSRAKATTTRVFTFKDPSEMLTEPDFTGMTAATPAYLQAVAMFELGPLDSTVTKFKVIVRDITDDNGSPTETLTAALTDAVQKDRNFWAVLMPEHGTANQTENEEVGTWVKNNRKFFIIVSDDVNIPDTVPSDTGTDLAEVFRLDANRRTFVIYSGHASTFPDGLAAGRNLPYPAGSVNWKFTRSPKAIGDTLTTTQRTNMDGDGDANVVSKNVNYFQTAKDIGLMTSSGQVSDGNYVDLVRGLDWMSDTIATDMLNLFLSNPKIPFTNPGINLIDSTLRTSLNKAFKQSIITEAYVTSVPDESEVSDADRASRCLTGVTFEVFAQGAINKVKIRGTIYI